MGKAEGAIGAAGGRIDALLENRAVRALRVAASLAGLLTLCWPGQPAIPAGARIAVGVIGSLAALSLVWEMWTGSRHLRDRIVHAIEAGRYGYGYDALDVKAYLDRQDGSMRVHRHVRVRTTAVQRRVRHSLHPLSGSSREPDVEGLHKIAPQEIDMQVSEVAGLSCDEKMVIEVLFEPPLDAGDVAEYEIQERFPARSFATTASQIDAMPWPYEYFSWHVDKPTRRLSFTVFVPQVLDPADCTCDVWYGGDSHQRHRHECHRARATFTRRTAGSNCAALRLDVPFPILGLVYVIRWRYH